MTPIERIRKEVFGLTQKEFADLIGVAQPTVSRWERGISIALPEMATIRAQAMARGLGWDDRWFFELPHALEDGAPAASCPAKSDAHLSQAGAR